MARREERKQAVREQILDAAAACFAERDFAAITIDDVVARSGVARATVYANFPNKEALAAGAARRSLVALFEEVERALARNVALADALAAVNRRSARWLEQNRALAARFFEHIARQADFSGTPAERPSVREALAEAFARAQEQGELRKDHGAAELASIYGAMWFNSCMRWTQAPHPYPLAAELDSAADVFLYGAAKSRTRKASP